MRIVQNTRGFQIRWSYYVTSYVNTASSFTISDLTKFNNMITYIAMVDDGENYYATIQNLSPLNATSSSSLAKYFAANS